MSTASTTAASMTPKAPGAMTTSAAGSKAGWESICPSGRTAAGRTSFCPLTAGRSPATRSTRPSRPKASPTRISRCILFCWTSWQTAGRWPLLLHDKRNALERVLLHFSHFAKETVRLDDQHYQLRLRYDKDDETELLIRVISFGPVLQVTDPPEFAALVKERLSRQSACFSPGGEG